MGLRLFGSQVEGAVRHRAPRETGSDQLGPVFRAVVLGVLVGVGGLYDLDSTPLAHWVSLWRL